MCQCVVSSARLCVHGEPCRVVLGCPMGCPMGCPSGTASCGASVARVSGAPARACRSSRRDASRRAVRSQCVQAVLVGGRCGLRSVWRGNCKGSKDRIRSDDAVDDAAGRTGPPGRPGRRPTSTSLLGRAKPKPRGASGRHAGSEAIPRPILVVGGVEPKETQSQKRRERERERTFQTESTQNKTDPSKTRRPGKNNRRRCSITLI